MIDLSKLEKQCPKCKGKGAVENTEWYHNLPKRSSRFQILESKAKLDIFKGKNPDVPDVTVEPVVPDEPVFFFCRNCYGRGKILSDEGKQLIEFIRFWLNPNY